MPRILWVLYTNYTLEFLVFPGIVEEIGLSVKRYSNGEMELTRQPNGDKNFQTSRSK